MAREPAVPSHRPHEPIPRQVARRLLEAVVSIGREHWELADRRRAFLAALADLVQADAGVWSWGRGWPDQESVSPVAILDFGMTDEQRSHFIAWGLDAETQRNFQDRVVPRVRAAGHSTDLRCDFMTDEEWNTYPCMRREMAAGGWEGWLHAVRYSSGDTWSNLALLRNHGRGEFTAPEAAIVDLALESVAWLHATTEETLPPQAFEGLTPRQRTVMLMLLDGLSRKAIAGQLGITTETVGDHIKSLYSHFGVNSASELAALFLRSR